MRRTGDSKMEGEGKPAFLLISGFYNNEGVWGSYNAPVFKPGRMSEC